MVLLGNNHTAVWVHPAAFADPVGNGKGDTSGKGGSMSMVLSPVLFSLAVLGTNGT